MSAKPYPPFRRRPLRYLRWHLRENWSNKWEAGPLGFEIEWVPRARYYVFSLTWDRTPEELRS